MDVEITSVYRVKPLTKISNKVNKYLTEQVKRLQLFKKFKLNFLLMFWNSPKWFSGWSREYSETLICRLQKYLYVKYTYNFQRWVYMIVYPLDIHEDPCCMNLLRSIYEKGVVWDKRLFILFKYFFSFFFLKKKH